MWVYVGIGVRCSFDDLIHLERWRGVGGYYYVVVDIIAVVL